MTRDDSGAVPLCTMNGMLRLRPVRAAVLSIAAAPLLAACGSTSSSAGATPAPSSLSTTPPPALVQVENSSDARPQWGLQHATVVYEYVTEGGITRFSALYSTPPSGRIGPVRSARRVTLRLATVYGAVIVYSGASTPVQKAIDASGLPHADEHAAKGDLYRVGGRQVPHNLVTDGDHLRHLLQRFPAQSPPATLGPGASSASPQGGVAATHFSVPFSQAENPSYTWDAASGGWTRTEPDTGAFVDADSSSPVVAATVIVQQVQELQTSDVEDANGAHGVDYVVSGSGRAQVFSGGREYDATWTQPDHGAPRFSLSGGGTAPIGGGLVWICLVKTGTQAAMG